MTGTDKKTVHEKLAAIQYELKAPKTGEGRFGKSRSAEDILAAVKPLAKKHEALLVVDDELIQIGEKNYVKATATLYDYEGNSISASAHAWEGEISRGLDASQVTGVATSYARKYAMGGLFAIDDTKDADTFQDDGKVPAKAPAAPKKPQADDDPATAQQKQQLKNMMTALGMDKEAMGLMVETVLDKQTVDTYGDFKAVVKAMEETETDE